jgi:hypothetical protein
MAVAAEFLPGCRPAGGKSRAEHRHARFCAPARAFVDKNPVNFGVLILVFDLRATFFYIFARVLQILYVEFESPWLER